MAEAVSAAQAALPALLHRVNRATVALTLAVLSLLPLLLLVHWCERPPSSPRAALPELPPPPHTTRALALEMLRCPASRSQQRLHRD